MSCSNLADNIRVLKKFLAKIQYLETIRYRYWNLRALEFSGTRKNDVKSERKAGVCDFDKEARVLGELTSSIRFGDLYRYGFKLQIWIWHTDLDLALRSGRKTNVDVRHVYRSKT